MKKLLNISLIFVMLFVLTGCSSSSNTSNTTSTTNSTKNTSKSSNSTTESVVDTDYEEAAEKQMSLPEEGETIAIMTVKDFGEIRFKFFEDVAPKAVENFLTHAEEGYYDGLTFHRVINEFMIQGGDPEGNGTGGESIWGEGFEEECSLELVPYRGSLCMASSGTGTSSIGSQFFITQANYSSTVAASLKEYNYPSDLIEQYEKYGGYMSLYLQYTVFGQVYEGMDVVDAIAEVETETTAEGQEDKPVEDVIIESIEVTTYTAE